MVMNKGTAKEKVQMVNARHRRTARIETSSGFPDHNFVEPPPSAAAAALALNPKLAPPAVASVRTIVRFALLSLLFCSLFIAAVLIVDATVVIPSFVFPPLLHVVVVIIILALVVFFFFLPAMKFPISKVEGEKERAIVLFRCCCCCCCCCCPPRKKLEPRRNDTVDVIGGGVSVIVSRVLCVCVYISRVYISRGEELERTRVYSQTEREREF